MASKFKVKDISCVKGFGVLDVHVEKPFSSLEENF